MKRIIISAILIISALVLSLSSCSKDSITDTEVIVTSGTVITGSSQNDTTAYIQSETTAAPSSEKQSAEERNEIVGIIKDALEKNSEKEKYVLDIEKNGKKYEILRSGNDFSFSKDGISYVYSSGVLYKDSGTIKYCEEKETDLFDVFSYDGIIDSFTCDFKHFGDFSVNVNEESEKEIICDSFIDDDLNGKTIKSLYYRVVIDKEGFLVSEELKVSLKTGIFVTPESETRVYSDFEKNVELPTDKNDYLTFPCDKNFVKSLLIIGDSISAGYALPGFIEGGENRNIGSFGNILAEKYGLEYGKTYFNVAVSGYTSSQIASLLERNKDKLKTADTLFVNMGGNDLMRPLFDILAKLIGKPGASLEQIVPGLISGNVDTELFEKNLIVYQNEIESLYVDSVSEFTKSVERIYKTVKEVNPSVKVVIQTVFNPFDAPDSERLSKITFVNEYITDRFIGAFNNVINEKAREYSWDIADTASYFKKKADVYTNIESLDVHPNKDGHTVIASLIANAVYGISEK